MLAAPVGFSGIGQMSEAKALFAREGLESRLYLRIESRGPLSRTRVSEFLSKRTLWGGRFIEASTRLRVNTHHGSTDAFLRKHWGASRQ